MSIFLTFSCSFPSAKSNWVSGSFVVVLNLFTSCSASLWLLHVHSFNIVTITLLYVSPPKLFSGFPFPSPSTWICLPPGFLFFHAVMEMATCSHTDSWTESWSSRGNACLPSHQLVRFPPYTMHGKWKCTILRHLRGENTPPRSYAIQKHKNVPYFLHGLFKNGQCSSRATCGVHERHSEHTAQRESGSVLSWLNMGVWWWLETIFFCQSTKLQLSLCVIDELVEVKWIKG